jgi:hypothetical protein
MIRLLNILEELDSDFKIIRGISVYVLQATQITIIADTYVVNIILIDKV